MKKYQLFKEHKEISIYGETPKEALENLTLLPMADKYLSPEQSGKMYGNKPMCAYIPQDDIIINKVIGIEDTSNIKRGDKSIIRAITETSNGIIAIDMYESQTTIIPA